MSALVAFGQPAYGFAPTYSFVPMNATEAAADPWHLRGQTFTTAKEMPPFDRYRGEIEGGRFVLRQGSAWHGFDDIDAVDFVMDEELLVILDRSGQVHAIDRKILDGVIFRAPTPVHQVSRVTFDGDPDDHRLLIASEQTVRSALKMSNQFDMGALSNVDPTQVFTAGDVLLIKKVGYTAELVQPISHDVITEEVGVLTTVIEYWLDMLHPYGDPKRRARRNAEIPWTAARALQLVDQDTLHRLTGRGAFWKSQAKRSRDRFKLEGEVDLDLNNSLAAHRKITPRSMAMIAAAALGGTAAAIAGFEYGFPPEFVQVVHATFSNWVSLVSPVLVDPVYRKTMFKSALWMSTVPPIVIMTAIALDRTLTKLGDWKATFVQDGMRVFGWLNEPIWRRTAAVLRQPHLIRALSLGVNPLQIVEPDSALGRRAGISKPVRQGWMNAREDNADVQKVVRAIETIKDNRHVFAHHLAITVVAEEEKLDLATVETLMALSTEKRQQSTSNPAKTFPSADRALLFSEKWNRTRYLLANKLAKELAQKPADFDVDTIDEQTLADEIEKARAAMHQLHAKRPSVVTVERLFHEWDMIKRNSLRQLYHFARKTNEFWRTARPKASLGRETIRNFLTDYYVGGVLTYLFGDRADPTHPENLVARAGAWFSTNRSAMFGIVDTARWWAINMPALMTGVYQPRKPKLNEAYNPREDALLKPRYSGPGVGRGLLWWLNDFRNPSTGNYGEFILNRLKLSGQMLQTTYLLTTFSRVILAGASIKSSSANYLLHLTVGHLWVGLIWDAVVPTNERMADRIEGYRERTEAATGQIYRGLRLGDKSTWTEGVQQAMNLFDDTQARASAETLATVERVRGIMTSNPTPEAARELLVTVLNHPPLPGKEPKWISTIAAIAAVVISTRLGVQMDVITFRPGLDWATFLMKATGVAAVAYTAIGAATKGWRYYQKKERETKEDCEFRLAEPSLGELVPAY